MIKKGRKAGRKIGRMGGKKKMVEKLKLSGGGAE